MKMPAAYHEHVERARDSSIYDADRTRDSRFFTRAGWLTPYALACGYQESFADVTLWAEGDSYHVRAIVSEDVASRLGFDTVEVMAGLRVWECFETLTAARAFFARMVHENAGTPA